MTSIEHSAATTFQLPVTLSPRDLGFTEAPTAPSLNERGSTEELREKFTQFVGEAFFGQMIKAMRSTVGKPAYFYGGRGEAAFQGQLDQKMAEELAKKSASRFAEPMFERQFPKLAAPKAPHDLNQLAGLRRQ